jgi:hypothetical protein
MATCVRSSPRKDESLADNGMNRAASTAGIQNQLYKELISVVADHGYSDTSKKAGEVPYNFTTLRYSDHETLLWLAFNTLTGCHKRHVALVSSKRLKVQQFSSRLLLLTGTLPTLYTLSCPARPVVTRQWHYEKDVNQCNSTRRVARSNGRWAAPV